MAFDFGALLSSIGGDVQKLPSSIEAFRQQQQQTMMGNQNIDLNKKKLNKEDLLNSELKEKIAREQQALTNLSPEEVDKTTEAFKSKVDTEGVEQSISASKENIDITKERNETQKDQFSQTLTFNKQRHNDNLKLQSDKYASDLLAAKDKDGKQMSDKRLQVVKGIHDTVQTKVMKADVVQTMDKLIPQVETLNEAWDKYKNSPGDQAALQQVVGRLFHKALDEGSVVRESEFMSIIQGTSLEGWWRGIKEKMDPKRSGYIITTQDMEQYKKVVDMLAADKAMQYRKHVQESKQTYIDLYGKDIGNDKIESMFGVLDTKLTPYIKGLLPEEEEKEQSKSIDGTPYEVVGD